MIYPSLSTVCHAGLLHKLKCYEISFLIFVLFLLFSVIGSFLWFQKGNLHKNMQLMLAGSPQGCIVGPTLFLLYFDDLPDVICSIAIYADDTTLYSKCDQASDL